MRARVRAQEMCVVWFEATAASKSALARLELRVRAAAYAAVGPPPGGGAGATLCGGRAASVMKALAARTGCMLGVGTLATPSMSLVRGIEVLRAVGERR